MEFRHRGSYGFPSSQYYPTTHRFSYAPFPPPPGYHHRYLPPPPDYGYYYCASGARMLDYRPWNEGYTTWHNLSLSHRPPKDPFLEREYERERIREELLREEIRRRIIEEEVRFELEMERYYGNGHSNQGYRGTWTALQFKQPGFSHGCHMIGPKGKAPRKRPKRCVRGIQHKIVEINEEELVSIAPVNGNNVNPSNKEEIQKEKQMVQTELNESKVVVNVVDIPHKMTQASVEEIRWPQSLLKDKVQSPKNQEESRPSASLPEDALAKDKIRSPLSTKITEKKGNGEVSLKPHSENKFKEPACSRAPFPEEALPKDKMKVLPSGGAGIEKVGDRNMVLKSGSKNKAIQSASSEPPLPEEALPKNKMKPHPCVVKGGDGKNVLKPETAKIEQLAFSESSKELLKTAEACASKRKSDSISAVPTPAATSSSDKVGLKKVKRQKVNKKEHSCTICNVTVSYDHDWLAHLNGKRHRNKLKIAKVEMNKKVGSDIGNKSMSGIRLISVKEEMDNGDSLATKPTGEELQKGIIKKIKVGCNEHDVVEKNNRLWCEMCKYNCSSMVMMTVHLVSQKHKSKLSEATKLT